MNQYLLTRNQIDEQYSEVNISANNLSVNKSGNRLQG